MSAYLIVRAEVDPAVRDAFDAWYRDEHLPDAVRAFGAAGAWRGWSAVDGNVHVAFYEFADLAQVNGGDGLRRAEADDRGVRPPLARQGDPDPRGGGIDPEDLNRGAGRPADITGRNSCNQSSPLTVLASPTGFEPVSPP